MGLDKQLSKPVGKIPGDLEQKKEHDHFDV